jgi:Holliday junction resolvase RusA-like endonuclease
MTEEPVRFTIPGTPIGKPRMSQRDKWARRPCVIRYREWADRARAAAPKDLTQEPVGLNMVFFLPIPENWSQKKKDEMRGQLHRSKPDLDNCIKSLDALFPQDQCIAFGTFVKRYDDGQGPRVEVEVR